MSDASDPAPTYNLWQESWLTLERPAGGVEMAGIGQALLHAHEYKAIYDPSPLVIVGIHRLLVAVLQSALNPQKSADLIKLWEAGHFPAKVIVDFERQYAARFDLFSDDVPFLQSVDLPLHADKGNKPKTISSLMPETPAGTEITHYHHGREGEQVFCPACAAKGLVTIPAFATSGGAGIKPSINGVPPIYILPGGASLFESLAASLVTPKFEPDAASKKGDEAWWTRRPMVERSHEVHAVGYLHSLTFPARRVRLHPELLKMTCTRCGRESDWGVRTTVFEMGESRPKDAPFWRDPFAAYRLPDGKQKTNPTPIRPVQGKATWREFAGLFLPQNAGNVQQVSTLRPRVLDQMAVVEEQINRPTYPFRCIGLRTDMKAKVFEWIDADFEVPLSLLHDYHASNLVREAIGLAADCEKIIRDVFRAKFGGKSKKAERHKNLKARMQDEYWSALSAPFRLFVLAMAVPEQREAEQQRWAEVITREARRVFSTAAEAVGDDAATLRERVEGERLCSYKLAKKREEYLHG